MSAPFNLPVRMIGTHLHTVTDAGGLEPFADLFLNAEGEQYVIKAINFHDRMVQAIEQLLWVESELQCYCEPEVYAELVAKRIDVLKDFEKINHELNRKE